MPLRDLVFMPLFITLCLLGLVSADLGIMLWLWTALGIPNSYLYGFMSDIPLNKVATAVALIGILFDRRRGRFYLDGLIILLVLLLVQGLLSYNLRLTELARADDVMGRFWKVIALCACMAFVRRDRLSIHSLLLIIALAGGIHGVLEGLKYIASAGGHRMQPPAALGDNNYVAMYCNMLIPLLAYLRKYSRHRLVRLGCVAGIVLLVVGVICSTSRGGFVGLVVLSLVQLAQSRRKLPAIMALLLGAMLLVVAAPESWRARMDSITIAQQDSSFMDRLRSWQMNTLIALDRPMTGGGFSASEDPLVFQHYLRSFDHVAVGDWDPPTHPLAAHSIYFQVLGDLGFPGLLLLLGILLQSYRNLSWVSRRTRGVAELAWAADLARSFRTILLVYCVCGAALSAPYAELAYALFMAMSLLRRHVAETLPSAAAIRTAALAPRPATVAVPALSVERRAP